MANAPSRYVPPPGATGPTPGRESPIPAGIVAGIRRLLTGAQPDYLNDPAFNAGWFGPGRPLSPVAPKDEVAGRQFDYPFGVNLNYSPGREPGKGGIDFRTLRRFADPAQGGLDIVRLLIETRKDQMAAQTLMIRARKLPNEKIAGDGGPKARGLEQMLQKPDGVHTFRQWLRMILEDHYVTDAPALYFGATALRPEPMLDVIDGTTLHLLLDYDGRTPQPPDPAYQQILKGVPAADYSTAEIGYYPYNLRSNRAYGMSRVEQIIGIVTIALNRQLSVLNYFTAGSVPDAFCELPDEISSPKQIARFQKWWDALLRGQLDERRTMRFLPSGAKVTFTKDELLKDAFDEWLARICCFAFSIPPQPFVKEMNRATAYTAKQTAQEEGLEPEKLWVKDMIDDVLARIGAPELECYWTDEEITDPQVKATVVVQLFGGSTGSAKPVITLEEARQFMGFAAPTADQLEELQPEPVAPPPQLVPTNGNGNGNGHGRGLTPATIDKLLGKGARPAGRLLPRGHTEREA